MNHQIGFSFYRFMLHNHANICLEIEESSNIYIKKFKKKLLKREIKANKCNKNIKVGIGWLYVGIIR